MHVLRLLMRVELAGASWLRPTTGGYSFAAATNAPSHHQIAAQHHQWLQGIAEAHQLCLGWCRPCQGMGKLGVHWPSLESGSGFVPKQGQRTLPSGRPSLCHQAQHWTCGGTSWWRPSPLPLLLAPLAGHWLHVRPVSLWEGSCSLLQQLMCGEYQRAIPFQVIC